ncbi:MAG: hypothetical protein H0V44_19110 [Planctomycetes bacterium]|nr:hypothetical protein [Planctomycetota bacterium]
MTASPAGLVPTSGPADGARTVSQQFTFQHLAEPWHALLFLGIAGALAWWAWRRYGPAPTGIIGWLARACRVAALIVLLIAIAGPAWRRTVTTDLPYRALVAIDRSASMSRADGPKGAPRIATASELAKRLERLRETNPLLAIEYRGIGGVPGPIGAEELTAGILTAPGASSVLASELDRVVAEGRPDLVIIVSDGRITAGSTLAAAAGHWPSRDMQVAVLTAGTAVIEAELFIDEIVVNREAALNEIEPVIVRLSRRGATSGPVTVTMTVEGEEPVSVVIDPETATADPLVDASVQLTSVEAKLEAVFRREGPAKIRITASAEAGATHLATPPQEIGVQVRERKLTVLMLAHRPFYELRYVREALKRDRTMTVHAYLADGRWRRWGTEGPEVLPFATAELAAYDAVIIGDLGPESLRESDLKSLEKAVRQGAGLVWLMSETGSLAGFTGSPIGDLLPAVIPDAATISRGFLAGAPRRLVRSDTADRLGLLDPGLGDGGVDWARLPALLGAAPLVSVKPAAEVLATDQDGNPLVVAKDYPNGRAILVAVDDTWRWRRGVGDRFLHRFHSQLLRYAASGRRGGDHPWRLFAAPRRAIPGESVTVNLVAAGTTDAAPDSVAVALDGPDGAQRMIRLEPDGKGFSARISAPPPGSWSLAIAAGIDQRLVDPGELKVLPPEDELRDPRLDRPGLEAFAKTTGGQIYDDAARLVAALPRDLRRSDSATIDTGLWDTWWMLVLLVSLFAVEWALRRANRLP